MTEGGLEMQMTPLSGQAPTWADIQHVYTTVSIAAAATAPYKNLATAGRDGYRPSPDLFVEHQGTHYYNVLLVGLGPFCGAALWLRGRSPT